LLSNDQREFVLENSKGYQLLRDIGWTGKTGLGKNLDGRKQRK